MSGNSGGMFMDREALIHFIGGAAGGTAGTAITCPLEVIKTRMQSSRGIIPTAPSTSQGNQHTTSSHGHSNGGGQKPNGYSRFSPSFVGRMGIPLIRVQSDRLSMPMIDVARFSSRVGDIDPNIRERRSFMVFRYFTHIWRHEGFSALYKGLIPNLIGVAPSKAVYFYTYSTSKRYWNDSDIFVPNSAIVHMVSAGSAGFVAATAVNPIWLVKTRLQLHEGKIGILQMIRRVYKREGIRGFYKGVTASYAGVSETMIQFVIYEQLRGIAMQLSRAEEDENGNPTSDKGKMDFLRFMAAGGIAKLFACIIAYPHEVVRTRLREESDVKRGFFSTLYGLYKEGWKNMYRGLSVQLLRTVPNTAITMGTYEVVVYMLHTL